MRILVCGSRDFDDREHLYRMLDAFIPDVEVIIEGAAKGADTLAREWAEEREIVVMEFPADWHHFGRAAGPFRNRDMINKGKPDLVLAFPSKLLHNTKGTKDMVNQARTAKVPVAVFGAGQL